MRQWASLDLDPDSFWSKTPREVDIIFSGKSDKFVREHNQRAALAYFVAYAPRGKKSVPLRKLLIRDRTPLTAEKLLAIGKQWVLAAGGKIEGKPN